MRSCSSVSRSGRGASRNAAALIRTTFGVEFKLDALQNDALAKELVSFSNFGSGIVLFGLEDDGSISGLTRANIEKWVMTTCRDQAPRGGARRGCVRVVVEVGSGVETATTG